MKLGKYLVHSPWQSYPPPHPRCLLPRSSHFHCHPASSLPSRPVWTRKGWDRTSEKRDFDHWLSIIITQEMPQRPASKFSYHIFQSTNPNCSPSIRVHIVPSVQYSSVNPTILLPTSYSYSINPTSQSCQSISQSNYIPNPLCPLRSILTLSIAQSSLTISILVITLSSSSSPRLLTLSHTATLAASLLTSEVHTHPQNGAILPQRTRHHTVLIFILFLPRFLGRNSKSRSHGEIGYLNWREMKNRNRNFKSEMWQKFGSDVFHIQYSSTLKHWVPLTCWEAVKISQNFSIFYWVGHHVHSILAHHWILIKDKNTWYETVSRKFKSEIFEIQKNTNRRLGRLHDRVG